MGHSKEALLYTSGNTIVRKGTRSKRKHRMLTDNDLSLKAGKIEENFNNFTVLQPCLFLHFWHLTLGAQQMLFYRQMPCMQLHLGKE